MLQNAGPTFRSEDKFVYAVRAYLCVSLRTNCDSHTPQVTNLVLKIFTIVVQLFGTHLQVEVGEFLGTVFLNMLESEMCAYEHKLHILELYQVICKDPSMLEYLYTAFDGSSAATAETKLFARIIESLAKYVKVSKTI